VRISIVVANNGRSLTEMLDSLEASRIKVDGLFIEDRGMERSAQRNLAIKNAIAKYGIKDHAIMWLDSDQSISPYLIGECKNLLAMGYTSLYIPEIIVADSWFGRVRKFEREFFTGTAVDVPRVVKAERCPLFDEEQSGTEDADWSNQLIGIKGTTNSPLYHHDDIQPKEYFRKKAYYAKSLARFAKRNPDDKVLNLRYRCWTIYTEKGKWRKLLRHPILSLGILFILAIRGVIYAQSKRNNSVV